MAGSSSNPEEPITDINVTPLVDVCLVLVIIFMAVAPFALTAGIKVLESKATATEGKVDADENVSVKLSADGTVTLNGKPVGIGTLASALAAALASSKDKLVMIAADDSNKVGQVVDIMDTARQAGAVKLAIMQNERPGAPNAAPPAAAPPSEGG